MKSITNLFVVVLISAVVGLQSTFAQTEDKTLSPYFKIISDDEGGQSLPLKSTSAEVNISGVVADVEISQVYENTGAFPIEAVYVFPTSSRAAIYDMEMRLDGRVIEAVMKRKAEAKATYTSAKQDGKRASLLEQERPNVFTMSVANIIPGDQIEVVLRYTENIIPEEGVYEFVYPTVVGPKYTGEQKNNTARAQNVAYTPKGIMPTYDFDFAMQINAGLPIAGINCTSHKTIVTYSDSATGYLQLHPSESEGGNRDVVVRYTLTSEEIETGLLLHEGEEENHFMFTVQPPEKVELDEIPQREYLFVVDVSGSMHGFPLDVTKQLMRNLMGNLRPDDKFNLLLFASATNVYAQESVYANNKEVERAINMLSNSHGGGGTRLMHALDRVMEIPKCEEGLSRSVVIITDGYISVEKDVFDLIDKRSSEFNFYSFGIGNSVNRYLIEGLAHVGNTEPLFVMSSKEAGLKAEKFRQFISAPVLTDIHIDWGGLDVYDIYPSNINDVLAERPVVVTGKYRGEPSGEIKLTGIAGKEKYTAKHKAAYASNSTRNAGIIYLWARNKIRLLDDYIRLDGNDARIETVTQLGLKYNLMTNYTSFVAVDNQEVVSQGDPTSVSQPLSLPQGVPNSAIGQSGYLAASGVGADLMISNPLDGTIVKLAYDINAPTLESGEVKFLEMEISKKIDQMINHFGLDKVKGLQLEMMIDIKGKIAKLEMVDTSMDPVLVRELLYHIEQWTFTFRKGENTRFVLSVG